jgi:radical SAM superfamily enzyme YgiQ (UPF0313 family)
MSLKKKIYFNEYNLLMGSGGIVYLPFVSGILSAYIKTSSIVRDNFDVQPFIFVPDGAEKIVSLHEAPDVACFSISMWSEQLSLEVARIVKSKFPNCLIIFGGASCPHEPTNYMQNNNFIDVCVRAEGEDAFLAVVEKFASGNSDFSNVPNVAFRKKSANGKLEIYVNSETPEYDRSLDNYPSPYLTGEYEYLLSKENHGFQAIVETNRGCPFLCTFCYWGKGGNNTKYRFKNLETVYAELEYLSSRKIEYIFNADSNFGMHQRDYDIALKLIELKTKNGYPEKFRTCWGKNTSERIFKIASLLQLHNLDKGVTLARQSNSDLVLSNIKRDNIKLEAYEYLEKNFNKLQVPIYAELILGLPGETLESWKEGIDQMLNAGLNNQLFIYQAEVYPNTELGSKEYQDKFKIKTSKIKLNEIHCSPRHSDWVTEYQHIVTETYSMSVEDWRAMTKYSLLTMLLHSMKVGIYVISYLHNRYDIQYSDIISSIAESNQTFLRALNSFFDDYVNRLLAGEGRGIVWEEHSDVYLEAEEIAFLRITQNKEQYFAELFAELEKFVPSEELEVFRDVVRFQNLLVPEYINEEVTVEAKFSSNIPEYCYSIFTNNLVDLNAGEAELKVHRKGYVDHHEFTKKQLVWARKSGTILNKTDVEDRLRAAMKVEFDIADYKDEKSFTISLFKENREKFEKFSSLKGISLIAK